jgi:Uma2 family endonuclease
MSQLHAGINCEIATEEKRLATNPKYRNADDVLDLEPPPGISGYELVDGELQPVSPAGPVHGELIIELGRLIKNFVKEHGITGRVLGDAGFVLELGRDPERLRGPDVAFVSTRSLALQDTNTSGKRFLRMAPDLAIEVESSRKPGPLQRRIEDYLEAGTRLLWVIHIATRSATVYRRDGSALVLGENDALDGEDVLPGLTIPLAELFDS